jgi:hypothetical protein
MCPRRCQQQALPQTNPPMPQHFWSLQASPLSTLQICPRRCQQALPRTNQRVITTLGGLSTPPPLV